MYRVRLEEYQLTDVEENFESVSWTDGPSTARIIFGPDGKLYLAIGAPGFQETLGETTWAQDLESRRQVLLSELGQRIRDVKQGPDGCLSVTTHMQDGAVLRIEPAP